ncbi:nitrilase-related carbon-nitrogen hydrolase [Colwellia sp. E2M01]|uniref:nitrilase-related carbon-nitrogen hydrolase n=1 Tax=Colwellia sp. E2M01 TaxID=2841561 RepID=UPI001C0933E6|nr:nitrilase-related carbon-nitrogen hydrolase [Colwellia sp. E2M01]MBU2870538.1 carbon-nitrogen hydrolase [Colwellia sp. E2M01]
MRVAVSQFAITSNIHHNLATCKRMIDEISVCKPDLIVLPEYCNTQFSHVLPSYVDHNQAWQEAVAIDGEFIATIAAQAKKYHCYIILNVSLQRDSSRNTDDGLVKSNISITSCLLAPNGKLIHSQDKQKLSPHESHYFIKGNDIANVISIPFNESEREVNLALLSGDDSMEHAVSRQLVLAGAKLLCNSINTFAIDQSKVHDFVRASDNNVFFATANKVGALYHSDNVNDEPQNKIIQQYLIGAGQSQIISPQGIVLAKLNHNDEGFTFADIDLAAEKKLGLSSKQRPDSTLIEQQRRPELYLNSQKQSEVTAVIKNSENKVTTAATANVAIFATYKPDEEAIEDVCHYIENNLSDIIQLPELFFIADKTITHNAQQRQKIAHLCQQLITQVSAVLRPFQYVCTSIIDNDVHKAVIIGNKGVIASQQQLHFCKRYQWTVLANKLNIIALPLEQGIVKLAMLTADDVNIAEMFELTAKSGGQLLLAPFDIQEAIEVEYNLLARATENRICIVAASREKSFAKATVDTYVDKDNIYRKNKTKEQKSTGLIINLSVDFNRSVSTDLMVNNIVNANSKGNTALLPQWRSRKFTGYLNEPIVKEQFGKITKAVVHPIAADR